MCTARDGVHRPLDADAVLELDQRCRLTPDATDELAALDDLQLIEAEAMAGRRDEPVIRRVVRRRENGAETLRLLRAVRRVELHLVHALLVVHDGALRAEELHENAA